MPTIIELGQKTKAKYPEYADMSDIDVGKKVKAKYPTEYADFTDVSETVEKPKSNVLEKTANVLGSVFGGNKIGEAIGTQIAKARATPEEKQFIEPGPTTTQLAGDVGRVALNFFPVGRVAKGLGVAGSAVKLGKLAKPVANIATGAGIGYGADVTTKLADGAENPFEAGTGTAIGTGLASIPYVGKALAKGGQEILGATTGTGAGTIKQFSKAITEGGEGAKVARDALRNNIEPQEIVDEARTAFGTIIKNRSDDYSSQLSKLKTKTNVIDHTPIIEKFNKQLDDFGVFSNADGTLNFSRSPGLGRYEKDLQAISKTLSEWGTRQGDNTIAGVDKLKQVIDDFRIGSSDSKKFDSFVTNLRSEAKNIIRKDLTKNKDLKTLLTYDKMLGDFEKSTKDIREIQKALSLGDKASTDTAFRKLSTVLRTNNEIRQKAVQELNEITGGTLIPKIAGQQLSEILPRGIARTLGTVGAGAGVVGGVGILPMLKLAAVSSPRVVGELLNALGIVGNKANIVKNAILKSGVKTPGDYLFDSLKKTKNNTYKQYTPEHIAQIRKTVLGDKSKAIVLDADTIKKMHPEYDPKNPGALHSESSRLVKELNKEAIDQDTSGVYKMIGGGSGSGKSEIVLPKIQSEPSVIFDGTLGGFDSAVQKIDYALSKGKTVELHPVYTPVELATLFNKMRSRSVLNTVIKENHFGFRDNIPKLVEKYGDKIKVIPYENKVFGVKGGSKPNITNIKEFVDSHKMSKDEIINSVGLVERLIKDKGIDFTKNMINSILK